MHKRTLLLLVLVALMGPAGSRAAAGGVPDGLGTSDWNSIRAEYERQRQAVFPVEGGHRARNFAQQWVSEFDGRGFLVTPDSGGWKWGLRLESYGWAGRAQAVTERPRVTAETERVSYDWDETLREWYVNDGRGLEHGFTLWQPPAGRGETLELNLAVRGGLEPRVRDGGRTVAFVDAEGRAALLYAGLKVWDADAVLPLGTQLGGASVDVTDSQGVTRPCLMLAARVETDVSSAQLNFIIAAGTATGPAMLTVRRASGGSHSITIHVVEVAPGIFTANSSGSGVPAANALRFVDGQLTDTSLVFDVTAFPFQATPIDLGPANHQVFLSLFATGIRNGSTVEVTIDGAGMTTIFGPAASSEFEGLDQLNVLLERVLIGRGLVQVVVTVDGLVANVVEINIF
jgi:uncharacterized protein (TIGR03437 family)